MSFADETNGDTKFSFVLPLSGLGKGAEVRKLKAVATLVPGFYLARDDAFFTVPLGAAVESQALEKGSNSRAAAAPSERLKYSTFLLNIAVVDKKDDDKKDDDDE